MNKPFNSNQQLEKLLELGKERFDEFLELGNELIKHIPLKDLATFFFPPALGLDLLSGILDKSNVDNGGFDTDYPDEKTLLAVLNMARFFSIHYFKTTIHKVEKFPHKKPSLVIGNHSAGLMPMDALFAINEIRDHYDDNVAIHPLVHDFAYLAPSLANTAKKLGILRANEENAMAALKAGRSVLIYPGGDEDAFRTFKQRSKIVLANRKGFIKLAMKSGVPIVPLVSVGLHESFYVVSKNRKLGKKLGIKRLLRTEILPFAFCLPWGFAPAFMPFLPLPTSIEMQFGEPIYFEGSSDNPDSVDAAYKKVESTMQNIMDELSENRIPLFGR